jgi:hypothetical protein
MTTAKRARSPPWANGPLMARKIKDGVPASQAQAPHSGPDLGRDSWSG